MLEINNITQLFDQHNWADGESFNTIFDALYPEIKKIANVQLHKNKVNNEVSPTVLVHECFLKLNQISHKTFADKKHFFNLVSRCMRFYLVELYRTANRKKNAVYLTQFTESFENDESHEIDVYDVHKALKNLEAINLELAELVELKFFAGLSFAEIAELHQTSKSIIYQKWLLAKSVLLSLIDNDQQA